MPMVLKLNQQEADIDKMFDHLLSFGHKVVRDNLNFQILCHCTF